MPVSKASIKSNIKATQNLLENIDSLSAGQLQDISILSNIDLGEDMSDHYLVQTRVFIGEGSMILKDVVIAIDSVEAARKAIIAIEGSEEDLVFTGDSATNRKDTASYSPEHQRQLSQIEKVVFREHFNVVNQL